MAQDQLDPDGLQEVDFEVGSTNVIALTWGMVVYKLLGYQ